MCVKSLLRRIMAVYNFLICAGFIRQKMNPFTLPPELRDFVGSAGDLLKEFERPCVDEKVFFRIFAQSPKASTLDSTCALYRDVTSLIESYYDKLDYTLHYHQGIQLRIVIPKDPKLPCHIEGILLIGENIEDEWMLTSALFELSKVFRLT